MRSKIHINQIVAIIIFISGAINIISAFFSLSMERLKFIESIIPGEAANLSRTLILLIGVFLMFLAKGLWEQRRRAWLFSTILIGTSLILHLTEGLNYEEDIFLFIPFTLLLIFQNVFTVKSSTREHITATIVHTFLILIFLFAYSISGFYILSGQFNKPINLKNIAADYEFSIFGIGHDVLKPHTRLAKWFEGSIAVVGFVSVMSLLAVLFKPLLEIDKPTEEERKKYKELCLKYGENSFCYMGLLEDKKYFLNKEGTSILSYKVTSGTAVVLGDPVSQSYEEAESLIKDFIQYIKQTGWKLTFYGVGDRYKNTYEGFGMKLIKAGEEAILYTNNFSLEGKTRDDIRHGVSRMQREGVEYRWYTLDQVPWKILFDVETLYRSWIKERKFAPLTFSFNYYPIPPEEKAYLLVSYSKTGHILTALTFYPYNNEKGMSLDFMLKSKQALNGAMEASIAESMNYFKNKGVEEVCLGTAPLLDLNPTVETENVLAEKIKQLIFENFNQFYNFKSLAAFKVKFQPEWRTQYLTYHNGATLPSSVISVMQAQTQYSITQSLVKKLTSLTKRN